MESEIAKLLNLNANDRTNLSDLVGEFFGEAWDDVEEEIDIDLGGSDDEGEEDFDETADTFTAVMENDACEEYIGYTPDSIDNVEREKATKYRWVVFSEGCSTHMTHLHQHFIPQDPVFSLEISRSKSKQNTADSMDHTVTIHSIHCHWHAMPAIVGYTCTVTVCHHHADVYNS